MGAESYGLSQVEDSAVLFLFYIQNITQNGTGTTNTTMTKTNGNRTMGGGNCLMTTRRTRNPQQKRNLDLLEKKNQVLKKSERRTQRNRTVKNAKIGGILNNDKE